VGRILIDYDGTISVKGKIDKWKVSLIKEAKKRGHTVKVYTSRRGEAARHCKALLKRRFGLNIEVMGGRENFDVFVDSKAGDWDMMKKFLGRRK